MPPDAAVRPPGDFASDAGETRLAALHGVATLDGFGQFSRAMLAAAGGLIAYLDHAGRGKLPLLLPPVARRGEAQLAMDEATRASLEILVSQQGSRRGSLIEAVDRCVTGAGARQLAEDLSAPLTEQAEINRRLALVQWLHDQPTLREDLRAGLRALPDIGRALGRVVAGRGSPRDLGQLRDGLGGAQRLAGMLAALADRPALLDAVLPALRGHGALVDLLARALVASPNTDRAAGGFIAEGYDAALDELRRMAGNSRRAIAALEAKYRDDTGVAALKIRHNGVLGYFIEVPAKHADRLMAADSGFSHRQTMAGARPLQRAGAARRGQPHRRGRWPRARRRGRPFRGTDRSRRRPPPRHCCHRCSTRPPRCCRRASRTRRRGQLVPPHHHRRAGAGDHRRAPSGGRSRARREDRALHRQ